MLKRSSEWFGLKKKLHERQQTPPLISEREIWWASVGENIGSEINGKSAQFSRPVIIYKKLSHGFYFVIPTTTQKKEGSWFVRVRYQRTDMTACLHQARAIDHRRLSSHSANSTATILRTSRAAFGSSINKYSPPLLAGPRRMPNVFVLYRKMVYCQPGTPSGMICAGVGLLERPPLFLFPTIVAQVRTV